MTDEVAFYEPSTLVERLQGEYRIPIKDGLGPVGAGEEPNNLDEFVYKFDTVPIQREAARRIAELEEENFALTAHQCDDAYGDESGNQRCFHKEKYTAMFYLLKDIRQWLEDDTKWGTILYMEGSEVYEDIANVIEKIQEVTRDD